MKKRPFRQGISLFLVLCMAFGLTLGFAGCAGGADGGTGGVGAGSASAASMFLRKTEGTVAVADAEGADVAPEENLGLYSGYTIGTEEESYAWIDLDKVKLAKLSQNSMAEIVKDGKNLAIDVTSGSLFFNVTEPLADDETMEISTSSLMVGIRGTCGWVTQKTVSLLEGTVTVTAGDEIVTITAGEQARLTDDGTLETSELTFGSIPTFVSRELLDDDALQQTVLDASGLRIPTTYEELLDALELEHPEWEIVHSEEIDFEADDSPEFLIVYVTESSRGGSTIGISIYRNGTEGFRSLTSWKSGTPVAMEEQRCALVESNDRYFVCLSVTGNYSYIQTWADYVGSVAERDGGPHDWGVVDALTGRDEFDPYDPGLVSGQPHDERGFIIGNTNSEGVDARGRYALVRELYVLSFEG